MWVWLLATWLGRWIESVVSVAVSCRAEVAVTEKPSDKRPNACMAS